MNSSQLLNALNKQSHKKHQQKNKSEVLNTIPQKAIYQLHRQNQFSEIKLPTQPVNPPQFLLQILKSQQNNKLVNKSIEEAILKVRKQKQKNIFLAFNDSHLAYLNQLSTLASHKNSYASNSINDVMLRRFNMVSGDLQNGKLIINHDRALNSKDQIQHFAELDRARLLKIKQGAIRSKLELLNQKMVEMQIIHKSPKNNSESIEAINKKIQQNLDLASYGLQSQKTKIAKDYVKYMTQQRRQRRKREQLREQRRLKIQQQRQAELKQAEQMRDLSKKQQILQRIQQTRKKRDEQEKLVTEKQQKIDKFLQKYRQQMPVFKKKQKQFEQRYLKPQKAYRQQKLKEIKQKKKSYSMNDIVDHQKKYQQLRKKQNQRKVNQKQMYLNFLKANTKQHYKGSVHKYVQQKDKETRQKNIALYQLSKNRKQKMQDYGKIIQSQYKPKVDENKRMEIMKLLEKQQMKQKKVVKKYRPIVNSDGQDMGMQSYYEQIKQKNRYKEGNRFMEQGNLKRKKNFSQSVEASLQKSQSQDKDKQQNIKLLGRKSEIRQKGSEKEIWKLRSKQMAEMSNSLNSPKQFEQVKVNFENLDKKAADKQKLMKHAKLSVQQFIEQKGALDQFYLQSIKNKMKLLQ